MIDLDSLKPAVDRAAKFQGSEYGAANSFFVVNSSPGRGVSKHRHPYEEIFIILEGEIETIINGETATIHGGKAVIIPPHTWHEFTNISNHRALMVTIHNSSEIIQENWEK